MAALSIRRTVAVRWATSLVLSQRSRLVRLMYFVILVRWGLVLQGLVAGLLILVVASVEDALRLAQLFLFGRVDLWVDLWFCSVVFELSGCFSTSSGILSLLYSSQSFCYPNTDLSLWGLLAIVYICGFEPILFVWLVFE